MRSSIKNSPVHRILGVILALLLCACQPTPHERMRLADAYLAEADFASASIELRNLLRTDPENRKARLMLARCSYQLGDFADSASQFEKALALGNTGSEAWLGLGRALLGQGKAQSALERVVGDLDSGSSDESVLVFLGDVFFALGNYDEAGIQYANALKLDAKSAGGLIGEAMILAAEGKDDEAEQVFEYAMGLNPESSIIWLARGNHLRSSREFSEAADAYSRAVELGDAFTPLGQQFAANVRLISSLIDSRRLDEAGEHLRQFDVRYPGHPVSEFLRGQLALAEGDFDTAQLVMQGYLSKYPRDSRGEAVLGAINFSQENLRQAELHLLTAVRAGAGGDATRRLLAETQLRLRKPEDALQVLRSGGALDPSDFMDMVLLGRAEIAAGDTDAAIRHFEQSAAISPENLAVNLALAAAYLKGDRAEDAVDLLSSLPVEPGSEFRRQSMLIVALLRQGERDKAIAESDRLLAHNETHAVAYLIAGALRELIGEDEAARSYYLRALDLDPDNLTAHQSISRIALANGDVQSAERGLRQLLHSNPGYYPAIVSLGTVLLQDRRLDELRPYVDRAIKQTPDSIAPRVILARLELALSRPDETLRIVNDVSAQFPDEPELSHLKGLAILAKGDHSLAVLHLARAAGAAPENARYQYDLARAQLADGRFDEAFATARRQVRSQPRDQRIVALGIEAAARAGEAGKAREIVDYFAIANPGHPSIAKFRGDVDLAVGDVASAVAHYESVAETNWSRDIVEDLARAYSIAGDRRALEPLTRWLDDNPDDHGVRFLLAQSLESLGFVDRAVAEYEYLLGFDALNVIGLNNLAWHYFVSGRSEALELAELAHEKAPNNGGVTDTLGWILAQRGDFERAVPLLREATRQAPDNAEIRFHLAEALAGSGETKEAERIIDELDRSGERYRAAGPAQQLTVD